ncbi:MAG: hypothetical protein HQL67_11045 [Magnetococcales bacterium]|nr:hypothetical protein [Magnetococcales bacterium]
MSTSLDAAVAILRDRMQELAASATPQDLSYLGKAIELIGGRTTVLDLQISAENHLADIQTEGTTQVGNVTAEGNAQVANVSAAGATQVDTVNATGATQVSSVITTGTAQVGNVAAEGTTQVAAVQAAGDAYPDAFFTGALAAENITYDAEGRITAITVGPRTIDNVVFNANGSIASFSEELVLNGITYNRNYTFTYDDQGRIASIAEA